MVNEVNGRHVLRAVGAVLVTVLVVVGVPVLLVALVGNPWPGASRVEMRDELALVVGVLAAVAWIVWARFVVALAVEIRDQVSVLRTLRDRPTVVGPVVSAPPTRVGIGLVAQRLVAAALVLLPVATHAREAVAADSLVASPRVVPAVVVPVAGPASASPAAPAPGASGGSNVVVASGDTLIALARTHLGDSARWREIFELNRDRPQSDGGRLTTPSLIRTGWVLELPAEAAPGPVDASPPVEYAPDYTPYLAASEITIQDGDNLWELSEARLTSAGLPHDDVAVADYLHDVIDRNAGVIEDPNLIFSGEQFQFPESGTPPPPPPPPPPAVVAPATEPVAPAPVAAAPSPAPTSAAAPVAPAVPVADPGAPVTTEAVPPPGPAPGQTPVGAESSVPDGPAPIGIGEAALLSAGVLALVASRRRMRLRASEPRARVPDPSLEAVAAERRLRAVDAGERLLRVDVAVRAAAASLVDGPSRIVLVRVGADGGVELTLSAAASLPLPWEGGGDSWTLPGSTPIELLAESARTVGAPCVALAQIGIADDGRDVLADIEALGALAIDAPGPMADQVVRGLAATLASSLFAEVANLVGVAIDATSFLDHRHAYVAPSVDDALELAATLLGSTSKARQSTFALRARHTSGEAWEPSIVLVGSAAASDVAPEVVRSAARRHGGLALVVGGPADEAPWRLRVADRRWLLEPIGVPLVPVGLSEVDLAQLHGVLAAADAPLLSGEPPIGDEASGDTAGGTAGRDDPAGATTVQAATPCEEPAWSLMVRLLGSVEVVDGRGAAAIFERSKALELIAWLALHRDRATRAGARTALWELDVRDSTFANVVSEARRAMARLVEPPVGDEWLGRTLTEVLPLHRDVITDVDLVRQRLDAARLQPPELAIETLRPAVEMVRDVPFAGTGYLWPDAEGITSNLVLLATSAATELAGHYLSMGDIDGLFWSTGQGLRVLPGHEELIALRMRGHARAGDLSGVRLEWESYERVLNADPWSGGEPAAKLVLLRRELLSS